MTKPTIGIFGSIEGHLSLAKTVNQVLNSAGYKANVNINHGLEFKLYRWFYSYFPQLFKYPYELGRQALVQAVINAYTQINYSRLIRQQFDVQTPRLAVSTWFFINPLLINQTQKRQIPLLNIIANPRSIHPTEVSNQAINVTFDTKASKLCTDYGISGDNIAQIGWLVNPIFELPYDYIEIRRQLGLDTKKITYLLVGGSEGSRQTLELYLKLLTKSPKTQLIFIAGKNRQFYELALKATQKVPQQSCRVLSFINNVHLYVKATDLVIGKAGPNLLFESVATHTPFFATNHVSGQEDGNLEIIKEYNLGYVDENQSRALNKLINISLNPDELTKFRTPLQSLALYNKQAKNKLLELVSRYI